MAVTSMRSFRAQPDGPARRRRVRTAFDNRPGVAKHERIAAQKSFIRFWRSARRSAGRTAQS